jgi:hypothetical protein
MFDYVKPALCEPIKLKPKQPSPYFRQETQIYARILMHVDQLNVDSLVGVPCFCCSRLERNCPVDCPQLERYLLAKGVAPAERIVRVMI